MEMVTLKGSLPSEPSASPVPPAKILSPVPYAASQAFYPRHAAHMYPAPLCAELQGAYEIRKDHLADDNTYASSSVKLCRNSRGPPKHHWGTAAGAGAARNGARMGVLLVDMPAPSPAVPDAPIERMPPAVRRLAAALERMAGHAPVLPVALTGTF